MTPLVRAFDDWIRGSFVELNTELEEIYFAQPDRLAVEAPGTSIKNRLVEEGRQFVTDLLHEGNTDEGFDRAFDLLGNVGVLPLTEAVERAPEVIPDATEPEVELTVVVVVEDL